jgi:alkylation response protein AidB-like acyl-CoA dehydrogenase
MPTIRGLITAAEIEPADVERILSRADALGVELVHAPAADTDELLALLEQYPDTEVMLGDFLPNVRGTDSLYAFGATAETAGADPAA